MLFESEKSTTKVVSGLCRVEEQEGMLSVFVGGIPVFQYADGDRVAESLWTAQAVENGWAKPGEIVKGAGVARATLHRHRRRLDAEGVAGLIGRKPGPKGPRLGARREAAIRKWHAKGLSAREMGRRLSANEGTVRLAMRRMGLEPQRRRADADLPLTPAGGMTAVAASQETGTGAGDGNEAAVRAAAENRVAEQESAPASEEPAVAVVEQATPALMDVDPTDRSVDRALAAVGMLEDALPLFAEGKGVPLAGVLLAMPGIVASGVLNAAEVVYGSIGPAFYGLRTTLVTVLTLALLRVKRPENLKEYSPAELGRVVGLDRAPEVKTLRRKLAKLSTDDRSEQFLAELVRRRVAARDEALGYLYVDGHVRVYHGKVDLPKAHAARIRLSVPATQDVWVNDADGQPLFFVTQKAHPQLVSALPAVLARVRELAGDRWVTVVFDRGGWSPKLFEQMYAGRFHVLTYRKGTAHPVLEQDFAEHEVPGTAGRETMRLHDTTVSVGTKGFQMRQVTRLSEGHQTQILTTRDDLPTVEVAVRMFHRWRQENFFKYMRDQYAIDALVEYGSEPDDPGRLVPNPMRKAADTRLRKAKADVAKLEAALGAAAADNEESRRRTMRGFKIANGTAVGIPLREAQELVVRLKAERGTLPERVPVGTVKPEVVRLPARRKRLSDGLKMLAYQVESDLAAQVAPFYARSLEDGRRLVVAALHAAADIEVGDGELRITIAPQSSPHRTRAIADLCKILDDTETRFPGTDLRLRYAVGPTRRG